MLTIKVQTNKAAAEKYMEDHLDGNTIYSEGEAPAAHANPPSDAIVRYYDNDQMRWHGSLASKLNLDVTKPITKEQFSRLLDNKNPLTGKQLTLRNAENRRLYFDATFSAPKSVSIMAITMGDKALLKAHDQAVQETLKELEQFALTRVRVNGAYELRKTGNILISSVMHATSRANDPQLHSHNLVFNVTWDEVEQKFKALEASEIYQQTKFLTEIYRHKLAEKIHTLGYETETHKNGFEIKGVDQSLREKFSKRSTSIKQLIRDREVELGRLLTNNEKSILTQHSRKSKSKAVPLNDLAGEQKAELLSAELSTLTKVKNKALVNRIDISKQEIRSSNSARLTRLEKAYRLTKDHLFERHSVVDKKDLALETMRQFYGHFEYKEVLEMIGKDTELFSGDKGQVGLIKGLAQEMYVNNFVNTNMNKFKEKDILKAISPPLREDQKAALLGMLNNKDQVMVLDGPAGTGKSFLLKNFTEILEKNNIQTLALAPTSGATANLKNDLNVNAQTLQSFLKNPDLFNDDQHSLLPPKSKFLIVDEAGLVSINEMELLFKIAEEKSIQILLVGDTRQHHSVGSGDALRNLKQYSNVKVYALDQVMRQKKAEYKEVVNLLQNQKFAKAWDKLDENGWIYTTTPSGLTDNKNIIDSYFNKTSENKSVIAVTPTRAELDELTTAIRHRKFLNYKDKTITKEVYQSLRLTNAEKQNLNSYIIDKSNPLHICFQKNVSSEIAANTFWQVISKDVNSIYIKGKGRDVVALDLSKLDTSSFDVIQKKEIEIKKGDTLMIQKSNKKKGFTNGEIVEVADFDNDSISLKDGRKLSKTDTYFDYGYASTSYSSQGKTCDYVLVSMNNYGGKAISAEQFYVSVSRGREGVEVFVEDKDYIKAHVSKLGARKLNLEIIKKEDIDSLSKNEVLNSLNIESLKQDLARAIDCNKASLEMKYKIEINSISTDRSVKNLQKQLLEKTPTVNKSRSVTPQKSIDI